MHGGGRQVPVSVVGGLGVGVLLAALVALPSVRDADRDPASGVTALADLRAGDCVRTLDFGAQASTVDAVPCEEPHVAQVYATVDLVEDAYPGDAETGRIADAGCTRRLEDVEGIPDVDLYDVVTFAPTEDSWADGDRLVQCLLVKKGGDPVTGSLLEGDE